MNNDLISIIVPAYNIADYLPRCLDSILNQTYSNIEIIVVSDGSTDNTNQVIAEYAQKDSRVVPIYKDNSGVTRTRIEGLKLAKGEWIGFVDGDDFIEPDMYERLLSNALKHSAQISHCGHKMIFPSRIEYFYNTGRIIRQDKNVGLKNLLEGTFVEPGLCNKLYRTNLVHNLLKDGKMDYSIKINEDLLMNIYLFAESENSVYEDFCPYHYIKRIGSATTAKLNDYKLYDYIKVKKIIFEYFVDNFDFELQSVAYSRYLSTLINLYRNVYKYKISKDRAKEYKQYFKSIKTKYRLSRRTKLEKFLFLYLTPLHMFVYKLYDKFISRNKDKYEVK